MELMAHQREGVAFLLDRGSGILAFEQGLGKTLVAIEAFRRLHAAGRVETMLVICPNSLKRNWACELARFAPELGVCIIEGSRQARRAALSHTRAHVVIINYEAARAEITGLRALLSRTTAVLVLDESHYVKNRRSLTSTAAQHFGGLAPYRWLLTGTPVTNAPADLYTQVNLVAGESALGTYDGFVARYADAGSERGRQAELSRLIEPYLLRRTKEECLDLPEKVFVDLHVPLPRWQRQLYQDVRDGIIREVSGMSREDFRAFAPTALTRLLRLSQVASNPRLVVPGETRTPGKVTELDRLLEELADANGRKVIVWSNYIGTIELLVRRYAAMGAVALYGDVPARERQDVAHRFQEDEHTRILIANPAAAGTGFTLTAAHHTVYETLGWRYDHYAQSQDRNHRIGQRTMVTYVRLIAEDTIDQVIAEALDRKAAMARGILGDKPSAMVIAEMSPDEFCRMLQTNRLPD